MVTSPWGGITAPDESSSTGCVCENIALPPMAANESCMAMKKGNELAGKNYFAAASMMAAARFSASVRHVNWACVRLSSEASMASFTPGMTTAA